MKPSDIFSSHLQKVTGLIPIIGIFIVLMKIVIGTEWIVVDEVSTEYSLKNLGTAITQNYAFVLEITGVMALLTILGVFYFIREKNG